jgi:C-terminal processing protease CtpA/Prc
MFVLSNVGSRQRMPGWRRLTDDFAALVLERKPSKFMLGVQLEIDDNDHVKLGAVTPGGAAAKAGLRAGDVLIKVNGKELGSKPVASLGAATQTGDPVELEIERDGNRSNVTVKPMPR